MAVSVGSCAAVISFATDAARVVLGTLAHSSRYLTLWLDSSIRRELFLIDMTGAWTLAHQFRDAWIVYP